jgi:hypothetical protein
VAWRGLLDLPVLPSDLRRERAMNTDDLFRLLAAGTIGLALAGVGLVFYGVFRLVAWIVS